MFGAVGDGDGLGGGTDDTQAWLDALATGEPIFIPARTYRLDGNLSLPSGTHLRGSPRSVLDFTNAPATSAHLLAQGVAGTPVTLSSSAIKGTRTIPLADTSQFAAGMMVRLFAQDSVAPARSPPGAPWWAGELLIVQSVAINTSLTVTTDIQDTYTTGNSAKVEPIIDPVEDVLIEGGKIVGNIADDTGDIGISFVRGKNCKVTGVRLERLDTVMIGFTDCYASRAIDNFFHLARSPALAYGVAISDACDGIDVLDNVFSRVRHAVTLGNAASYGGIPRNWRVNRNRVFDSEPTTGGGYGDAIDTHAAVGRGEIAYNEVVSSSGAGVNVEGFDIDVHHNRIVGAGSSGIQAASWSARKGFIRITDNLVRRCGDSAILVNAINSADAMPYESVEIDRNDVRDAQDYGIRAVAQSAYRFPRVKVTNNVAGGVLAPIYISQADGFCADGNVVTIDITQSGIRIDDSRDGSVLGNKLRFTGAAVGIAIDLRSSSAGATDNVIVDGNLGAAPAPTGRTGLKKAANCTNIKVGPTNSFHEYATPGV